MISTIVCIGSGIMGFALMKKAAAGNIFFTDIDRQKAQAAADALCGKVLESNAEAAEKGDFIFLAVKPQIMQNVLEEIKPVLEKRQTIKNPPVLVSIAAGWSIGNIQKKLGLNIPVVRLMPNTPVMIGKGLIVMASSPEVTNEKNRELESLLGNAGIVDTLEEKYFDAVTGISGSGPAFVYMFIESLADGGVFAGLPRDKVLRYASQTVLGAAAMVQETGKLPSELKDMVTSPGGTTIAGIAELENGSFRGTVMNAVKAAWKRALELGKI